MQAITIVDGSLRWQEHPDPIPGSLELLIAVKAAGINAGDLLQRAGHYPAPPGSPADIPGLEAAGEVIEVGPGVTRFRVGDRVMAVVGGGAQAQRLVVHERCAIPIPDGIPWDVAGGFPEAFTTAHDAIFTQVELAMGERICVHAGAGGVGVAAIQLAVAAGAGVTATVRNRDVWDEVSALGAKVIEPDGFVEHGPFDVILELIGGPNLADDLRALAIGGRITVIGVGAGARSEINLLALMGVRGRIHGSTLRARPLEDKAAAAQLVERHVVPLLADGRVNVPITATFDLADAASAYDRFAAGGKFGKIVLINDQ
ncbi:MAG TPA: zinc-binding dehydrogenase [Microthrixaceae bacterium]|nr:zinc-binding dehydrogenase [Microthrixaceae bacterium]